jgi:hypothetical protein
MTGPTPEQEREAMEAMVEHERSNTARDQRAFVWRTRLGHVEFLAVAGRVLVEFEDDIAEWFDLDCDAPGEPGLWVWEGSARWYGGGYETPHDGEWCLEGGTWRRPTEAEMRHAAAGQSPFSAGAPTPESEMLSNQVETLSRLAAAWAKQPDMRLGQLLLLSRATTFDSAVTVTQSACVRGAGRKPSIAAPASSPRHGA